MVVNANNKIKVATRPLRTETNSRVVLYEFVTVHITNTDFIHC